MTPCKQSCNNPAPLDRFMKKTYTVLVELGLMVTVEVEPSTSAPSIATIVALNLINDALDRSPNGIEIASLEIAEVDEL